MEERRFDDLTRALGQATTRRQLLKGLLGTAVGGMLAAVGVRSPDSVSAASCSKKTCKQQAQQQVIDYESTNCNSLCHDPKLLLGCIGCQITANRLYHQWLQDCERGDGCLSVANQVCCDGSCVDVTSDPANCGSCHHACQPGEVCRYGECQCGEHGTICNGQCVDTQTDAKNCGSCGHVCGTCETCVGGQCVAVDCGAGKVCCQDQCISLCPGGIQPDPSTCQCPDCDGKSNGSSCSGGTCCNQQCVNIQSDAANCGGCGTTCTGGKLCIDGVCQCLSGETDCNGQCVDLSTDVNNCGQCGTACNPGDQCCDGTCKANCGCPQDRVECNGVCCQANQICESGQCISPGDCNPACGPDEICCTGYGIEGNFTSGCVSASQFKVCPVTPISSGNGSRGDWTCCPIDQDCCGGTGYFYNICGGATEGDQVVCCEASTLQCGFECCDQTSQTCLTAPYYDQHPGGQYDYGLRCCPNGSGGVLWDGTCCAPGQQATLCRDQNNNVTGEQCLPPGEYC